MSAGEQARLRSPSARRQAQASGEPARSQADRRDQADRERSRAEELLRTLTEEALKGTVTFDKDVTRTINAGIEAIDEVDLQAAGGRSCTSPSSRSWKAPGAGCTTW